MGIQRIKKAGGGYYEYERVTHFWTVNDLARIAKHLKQHNKASAIEIVAIVATVVGLGFLICKAAKVYKRITNIFDFINGLAINSGIVFGLKALLNYLLKKPFLSFPVVDRVAYVVIAVLIVVTKLFDAVTHFAQDILFIEEVADTLEQGCDFVKKHAIESNIFDDIDFDLIDDIQPPSFDFSFDSDDLLNQINNISDLFEES